MSLSSVLKQRRKDMGLTLAQVADLMGVSEATVQRWESGNIKSLRQGRIAKLAEILSVNPATLMGWDELEPKEPATENDDWSAKEFSYLFSKLTDDQRKIILTMLRGLVEDK